MTKKLFKGKSTLLLNAAYPEIRSTTLKSESERGKQCFVGFRGGRTRFFGENFLDGFLQYPWPGEWGGGGGGEESLQKPCKKVTLSPLT